ncbi:hypothetical protein HYFRA_00002138 [Hymenoscyphus fraxineus]|uniref:Uncharacterized protein n=1 Tax=Hymenoscyphus fraxineus TaxID=746836 RepID=A0A9N9PMJ9_9HELO|nr:hypothetical protein HYFRA_00002138 [Hymenoscyphus fraxineus]
MARPTDREMAGILHLTGYQPHHLMVVNVDLELSRACVSELEMQPSSADCESSPPPWSWWEGLDQQSSSLAMSDPGTPMFVDDDESFASFSPMQETPSAPHPRIAALERAAETMDGLGLASQRKLDSNAVGVTRKLATGCVPEKLCPTARSMPYAFPDSPSPMARLRFELRRPPLIEGSVAEYLSSEEAQSPARESSLTPTPSVAPAPAEDDTAAQSPPPDPNSLEELTRNLIRKVPLGTRARLAAEAAEKAKMPVEQEFPPEPTQKPIDNMLAQRLRNDAPLRENEQLTLENVVNILNPRPRDNPAAAAPREAPIPAIAQYPPGAAPDDGSRGFVLHPAEVSIHSKKGYQWVFSEVDFRKASKDFAKLLDEHKPITRTKAQRDAGNTIKWKFELVPNEENPTDLRLRSFKWINPASKAKLKVSDLEHDVGENPPFNQMYDLLFRIITNNATDFGPVAGVSIEDKDVVANDKRFVARTIGVLILAEEHGAMDAVGRFLEMLYLRMGQRLWDYIRGNPETWINIATRIQSPIIFREAILHCVGKIDSRYQRINPAQFRNKGPVFLAIEKLIQKKIDQLKVLKKKTEEDLINFWPVAMFHPHSSNAYIPDKSVYASDIYLIWMQYIANAFTRDYHHRADDGGIRLYRTIAEAGVTYLTSASLHNFTSRFAMSARALEILTKAVEDCKTEAAEYMKELTRDNTQGQSNTTARLGYLTCVWVEDDEFPF